MAEAIAIFFVQPVILTVLSALLLGERLRIRRIMAILVGLAGTLIILQPSLVIFGWPAALPLASATSMALYGDDAAAIERCTSLSDAVHGKCGIDAGIGAIAGGKRCPWLTLDSIIVMPTMVEIS